MASSAVFCKVFFFLWFTSAVTVSLTYQLRSRVTRSWRQECRAPSRVSPSSSFYQRPASSSPDLQSKISQLSSVELDRKAFNKTLLRMLVYSALLGPCLDNFHGLFGVLTYTKAVPITFTLAHHTILKTAAWVPPLFGLAGVIMSYLTLKVDQAIFNNKEKEIDRSSISDNFSERFVAPSWSLTLYSIIYFASQYFVSGLLDNITVPNVYIHAILAALAVLGVLVYDRSVTCIVAGAATAIAGPVAEIILINMGHLYYYTHADIWGICSWIPWVYFLGAAAVGNLARRVYKDETLEIRQNPEVNDKS